MQLAGEASISAAWCVFHVFEKENENSNPMQNAPRCRNRGLGLHLGPSWIHQTLVLRIGLAGFNKKPQFYLSNFMFFALGFPLGPSLGFLGIPGSPLRALWVLGHLVPEPLPAGAEWPPFL